MYSTVSIRRGISWCVQYCVNKDRDVLACTVLYQYGEGSLGVYSTGCFPTRARQRQDNDKTKVEPVHSYDAFHTRHVGPGVKGIIGMHMSNMCLVVLPLSCSGVKTPLLL